MDRTCCSTLFLELVEKKQQLVIMRTFILVTCAWLTPVATYHFRYTVSKHGKKLPRYAGLEVMC